MRCLTVTTCVALAVMVVHCAYALQCAKENLRETDPTQCGYRDAPKWKKCHKDNACLHAKSDHSGHTCIIDMHTCQAMTSVDQKCSFEMGQKYVEYGCKTDLGIKPSTSIVFPPEEYKCGIDISNSKIICICHNTESVSGSVLCGKRAGMPLAVCLSLPPTMLKKSFACFVKISSMDARPEHKAIYDNTEDKYFVNIEQCKKSFGRIPVSPNYVKEGHWCCIGYADEGIACDHICYNKEKDAHEVCPKGQENCYYQNGSTVDEFTSGCADTKKDATLVIKRQNGMQCWDNDNVGTNHYICVRYDGHIVQTYANKHKLSVGVTIEESMEQCAKVLLTPLVNTAKPHCIQVPLVVGGKEKTVDCGIATKLHSATCNAPKEGAQKLCWNYGITRATLKDKKSLNAIKVLCDTGGGCSKLLVDSKLDPQRFWSGCKKTKPNGFTEAPKHITVTHPLEVAKVFKQCGNGKNANILCWKRKKDDIGCVWWQQTKDATAAQLGCVYNFTAAAGTHIKLNAADCPNKEQKYAVDETSGHYIKWQCCKYGYCGSDPLANSDNLCPVKVTQPFTEQDLRFKHTNPTTVTKVTNYTMGKGEMTTCSHNDPCSQGVQWDSDNVAKLVVDCQSKIPTNVPTECKHKAIVHPPKWPVGPVDKRSKLVADAVLELARCITGVECDTVTSHTGSVSPTPQPKDGGEPPQCTAAANGILCHWLANTLIAILLLPMAWL